MMTNTKKRKFYCNTKLLYSIVEFAVRDDMEYALKKLNDRELNGQRVTLREVKRK
jgi:hypothetical protein